MHTVALISTGRYHDFSGFGRAAERILKRSGRYSLQTFSDPAALDGDLSEYAAIMLYLCGTPFSDSQVAALRRFVSDGGGLIAVHGAVANVKANDDFYRLIGARFDFHPSEHQELDVVCVDREHPITLRLGDFRIRDELYVMKELQPDIHVLAQTRFASRDIPLLFTRSEGRGRVFYTALGHGPQQWALEQFQTSLVHGTDWACGVEPDEGPIRTAVIGYGYIGPQHVQLLDATPGLEPVAVVDPSPQRREAAQHDLPNARVAADVDDLLADAAFDLAVVCSPNYRHRDQAVACANAGKHLVVDKPLALNLEQADEIIAAAEANNVMLSVFHNRRWDADFRTMQRLIGRGAIGRVHTIACGLSRYRLQDAHSWWTDAEQSGGLMYCWGPHFVDWALRLMPAQPDSVQGFAADGVWAQTTIEDHAEAVVRFADGARAEIFISDIAASNRPRWRIEGTRGAIVDDGSIPGGGKLIQWQDGRLQETHLVWEGEDDWIRYYYNVADHLLRGDPLAIPAEQSRQVVAILDGAGRSAAERQPRPL